MKKLITVMWSITIEMDVDPKKICDVDYRDQINDQALARASDAIDLRDGEVTAWEEPI